MRKTIVLIISEHNFRSCITQPNILLGYFKEEIKKRMLYDTMAAALPSMILPWV